MFSLKTRNTKEVVEKIEEKIDSREVTEGKYLIISDSHGNKKNIMQILEKETDAQKVIFLGDGLSDIAQIKNLYPSFDFEVVRGNCDIGTDIPSMQILALGGLRVLICHGDGFDVKMSLLGLRRAAITMGANVALYGHTHKQYYEYLDGLYIFCPGSVEKNIPANANICYGVMEIKDAVPVFSHRELE